MAWCLIKHRDNFHLLQEWGRNGSASGPPPWMLMMMIHIVTAQISSPYNFFFGQLSTLNVLKLHLNFVCRYELYQFHRRLFSFQNICVPLTHLLSGVFSLVFLPKFIYIFHIPRACYIFCQSHHPWCNHHKKTWWRIQTGNFLIIYLSLAICHFPFLSQKILVSTLHSDILNVRTSRRVRDGVSHSYYTGYNRPIDFYILLVSVLDRHSGPNSIKRSPNLTNFLSHPTWM
jgi:hypothetical protein